MRYWLKGNYKPKHETAKINELAVGVQTTASSNQQSTNLLELAS